MTPEFDQANFQQLFVQRFDEHMAQIEADHIPSMSIISVFFTFYGLNLLKKNLILKSTHLAIQPCQ